MTFSILQQVILCSEQRFTGKLSVTNLDGENINNSNGNCWNLYFFRGRLVGDSAGTHPVRRLRRQFSQQQIEFSESIEACFFVSNDLQDRNYFVIKKLIADEFISRQQAEVIIEGSLIDVLFDIFQYESTTAKHRKIPLQYLLHSEVGEDDELPAILIKPETILQKAHDSLRKWRKRGFLEFSPNLTPYINDPIVLQSYVSSKSFENMVFLLDGDRTLRDIAIKVDEDLEAVMQSALKYRNLGFLSFRTVSDAIPSESTLITAIKPDMRMSLVSDTIQNKNTVIAHLGKTNPEIKETIENAGHDYVNLHELSRIMINLIQYQPNLILVDSLSTNINSNEFCGQIRRTNKFRETPVIFFNSNANIKSWLHNRIEYSTEYITKQFGQQEILAVLNKYV